MVISALHERCGKVKCKGTLYGHSDFCKDPSSLVGRGIIPWVGLSYVNKTRLVMCAKGVVETV